MNLRHEIISADGLTLRTWYLRLDGETRGSPTRFEVTGYSRDFRETKRRQFKRVDTWLPDRLPGPFRKSPGKGGTLDNLPVPECGWDGLREMVLAKFPLLTIAAPH